MSDTVTESRKLTSKSGMGIFGWLMFLGMVIVLVPLIPLYLLLKLYELATRDGSEDRRPVRRRQAAR